MVIAAAVKIYRCPEKNTSRFFAPTTFFQDPVYRGRQTAIFAAPCRFLVLRAVGQHVAQVGENAAWILTASKL